MESVRLPHLAESKVGLKNATSKRCVTLAQPLDILVSLAWLSYLIPSIVSTFQSSPIARQSPSHQAKDRQAIHPMRFGMQRHPKKPSHRKRNYLHHICIHRLKSQLLTKSQGLAMSSFHSRKATDWKFGENDRQTDWQSVKSHRITSLFRYHQGKAHIDLTPSKAS